MAGHQITAINRIRHTGHNMRVGRQWLIGITIDSDPAMLIVNLN